jgi:hypothetical protein
VEKWGKMVIKTETRVIVKERLSISVFFMSLINYSALLQMTLLFQGDQN